MRTCRWAEQRKCSTLPSNSVNNCFSSIKMSCVWSLAEQCSDSGGKLEALPPRQSSRANNAALAFPPRTSTHHATLLEISTSGSETSTSGCVTSSTSGSETSNSTHRQQSLSSEVLPNPLSDDQCLELLNQSVIPTSMFENYLARVKRKERERSKRSQCEVKKWWLPGKKVVKEKLTCSKCNRVFHKAFGLQVHSRMCQVSSALGRKFHCEICQAKLRMASVKGHMKGKHQLDVKDYGALYQRRLFNCKICDANIDMNRTNVVGHLEKLHFLSLNEYCSCYGPLYTKMSPGNLTE